MLFVFVVLNIKEKNKKHKHNKQIKIVLLSCGCAIFNKNKKRKLMALMLAISSFCWRFCWRLAPAKNPEKPVFNKGPDSLVVAGYKESGVRGVSSAEIWLVPGNNQRIGALIKDRFFGMFRQR